MENSITDKQEKEAYEIEIIRSNKRRKTISAKLVKDTMLVYVPTNISDVHLGKVIENFRKRFQRQGLKRELNKIQDLKTIADRLNKEYFAGKLEIKSIEYVTNQYKKFGCCNHKTQTILISHRLAQMPHWVRDYVIIHEMAHLIEPSHSKLFWEIVFRYKLAERAKGYLIAKGLNSEQEPDDIEEPNLP